MSAKLALVDTLTSAWFLQISAASYNRATTWTELRLLASGVGGEEEIGRIMFVPTSAIYTYEAVTQDQILGPET